MCTARNILHYERQHSPEKQTIGGGWVEKKPRTPEKASVKTGAWARPMHLSIQFLAIARLFPFLLSCPPRVEETIKGPGLDPSA